MTDHPVITAVAPLREQAIEAARKFAERSIRDAYADLQAHGWDLQKVAPYPLATEGGFRYMAMLAKRRLYLAVVSPVALHWSFGNSYIVREDKGKARDFIAQAEKDADATYERFVTKLVQKIGPCLSASLTGENVWSQSVLEVHKETGVELWKTQCIVNISKYGKVFNQWPTRKMKGTVGDLR